MTESITYKNNIFISYSEADREWVQNELLPRLRNAGLRVIDQHDFVIGAPKLVNSEQAVESSQHTLVVVTPEWVASEWAEFEELLISSMDPAARQRRLIPLLLRPCELPARIAMLTCADFTNPATREAEITRLLRSLGAKPKAHTNDLPIQPSASPTPSSYKLVLVMLVTNLITVIVSLLSNVVAGYLTPTFEDKRWLAVGLFVLLSLISFWISLPHFMPSLRLPSVKRLRQFTDKTFYAALIQSIQVRPKQISFIVGLSVLLAFSVWLFSPTVDKLWAQNAPRCPPDYTCVLVANFLPEDSGMAHTVAQDIMDEIRTVLDKAASGRYAVRTGAAFGDAKAARARAVAENDALVVWGEVQENTHKLRIHFELVNLLEIGESHNGRAYRAEPLLYDPINRTVDCFKCLYIDLSAEVAQRARIVAYTTAGLVDYVQDQPEQARFALMAALYCGGEPMDETVIASLQPDCSPTDKLEKWNAGLLYYYLGKALILQGDYRGGIRYLEQAANLNPHDPSVWIGIGSAYQSWLVQPKAPVAVAALNKAEELAKKLIDTLYPNEPAAVYHDLGLIDELRGDMAGAQTYYAKAVEQFGADNSNAYISLVSLGRVQRVAKSKDAQNTLEHARSLDPHAPSAYLELALVHQNERDIAEQLLQEAAAQQPFNAVYVYMIRAELCEKRWQDRNCARESYERALKLRPNDGWLQGRAGDFYRLSSPISSENWQQAQIHYQKAVDLRPQDPWAHERLAYVLFNQQAYPASIQEYQRALQLLYDESQVAAMYCNLARAQQRALQASEAHLSFERCTMLKPP